jgi:hypothetical protein
MAMHDKSLVIVSGTLHLASKELHACFFPSGCLYNELYFYVIFLPHQSDSYNSDVILLP